MNISKYIAFAAVAAVATGAFAEGADNKQVIFLSTGPDYYADGKTLVKEGEWFACCWSSDGVFEGVKGDYTPIDPNDKVVDIQSLNRNQGYFSANFQFDANAVKDETGKFCVIILDTREGGTGDVAGADETGKPERSPNAAIAIANYTVTVGASSYSEEKAVANAGWSSTALPSGQPAASISSIDPSGDKDVVFTIENANANVRYDLKAGTEPGNLTTYVAEKPITGAGTVEVSVPKSDVKFFKLTPAPLAK